MNIGFWVLEFLGVAVLTFCLLAVLSRSSKLDSDDHPDASEFLPVDKVDIQAFFSKWDRE